MARSSSVIRHKRTGVRPTVKIRLNQEPLHRRTVSRTVLAGLALVALGTAIGWGIVAIHPVTVDAAIKESPSPAWLVTGAEVLGYLGHALFVTPVAVGVAVFARLRWGTWDLGWLMLMTFGGSTAVTGGIKLLTDRARPEDALTSTLSSAFPSGHAVRAVAVYGLVAWLLFYLARTVLVRNIAIPLAVTLIGCSGVARIGLGVHWPTDVLAGFAVGATWLACSLRLLRPQVVHRVPAA